MHTSDYLPFLATTALARETLTHVLNYGVSKSLDLLDLDASPLCWDTDKYLQSSDVVHSTSELAEAAALWAYSTPCVRNGTKEYCAYSNPDFAGRGISILTSPARAIEIAKSSLFLNPEPLGLIDQLNAEESPVWKVQEILGKGKGLIATKNLELGDHIMSTTASIMIDYDIFYNANETQVLELEVGAVQNLPQKHSRKILDLSTHDYAADFETQVSKVILTNSFDLMDTGIVSKKNESEGEDFYTVFPEISRLNHDCRPNADYHFDRDTFTQHIHAVKPIAAGEEITISYIDPLQTREDRLKRLDESWHFACSCSLCTQNQHHLSASDARIQQIQEIRKQLRDWEPHSQATTSMAELMISLYHQERLWQMLYEAYTFAALEYNGAGEPWTATKYARLAIQHGLSSGGPNDPDVKEMTALARNPWNHWSWMLRTRKRMNWDSHVDI